MTTRDSDTAEKIGDAGRKPVPGVDMSPISLEEEAARHGWTNTTSPSGTPHPAKTVGTKN